MMMCAKFCLKKAGKAGGMDFSAFIPAAEFEKGLPVQYTQTRNPFTGLQEGLKSANFDGNPHWNDVLVYRADGSNIHFGGMDYSVINRSEETYGQVDSEFKYNICCWKKCCAIKGKGRVSTTTTWMSHDGAHEIKMKHKDNKDPEIINAKTALCAVCFPFTCLCFSAGPCKSCCVSKTAGIKYSAMEPEIFEISFDTKPVGSVTVMPGKEKSMKEPEIIKQTTALSPEGQMVWVMNDTEILQDVGGEREMKTYHCCTGDSGKCDQCVPLCCPVCLPMGGCSNCPSCLKCCFPLFKCCGCMCQCGIKCCCTECYCFKCCSMTCNKCCPKCDGPCCALGKTEHLTEPFYREMPVDTIQKVHRVLYPVHKDAKNHDDMKEERVAGWAAYTTIEAPGWPSRASFTKPAGSFAPLDLLALPLLIDLGMGTENKLRDDWTFAGSELFAPFEVVNHWPRPQVLESTIFNMNRLSLHNCDPGTAELPTLLCKDDGKPQQQSMTSVKRVSPGPDQD